MTALMPVGCSQHGRFEVRPVDGDLIFRDWLLPYERRLPAKDFAAFSGVARAQAWFENGLVPGALGGALSAVAARPGDRDDPMFWQFPCRTEGAAWDLHAELPHSSRIGDELHLYLGMPWATWIDKARKLAWGVTGQVRADRQCRWTAVRLRGLRQALDKLGLTLRVHTVCQHIYWADLLPTWRSLGVTDLWLSHCPDPQRGETLPSGVQVHPWRLFAVNVEDEQRRVGLQLGRDPAERPLLASFIGAHADHYLSDIRLRLRGLSIEPDFRIEVTGQWHFEKVVYGQQVQGIAGTAEAGDPAIERYNRQLNDSVFSLCPAGAGANTLRLWESLASGAIPVLLGPWPRMPEGGTLASIDWDRCVIRVRDAELGRLAQRLRAMSLAQRRAMQQEGRNAFEAVRRQRCF